MSEAFTRAAPMEAYNRADHALKEVLGRFSSPRKRQAAIMAVLRAYGLPIAPPEPFRAIPIVGKLNSATGEWDDGPYTKQLRGEADRQINDASTGEVTE